MAFRGIWILAGVLGSAAVSWGEEPCAPNAPKEDLQSLVALSESIGQIKTAEELKDIPEFCRVLGYRGYQENQKVEIDGPWVGSFVAVKEARESGFRRYLSEGLEATSQRDSVKPARERLDFEELKRGVAQIKNASPDDAEFCRSHFEKYERFAGDQAELRKASLTESAYFCSDLTLSSAASCASGMTRLQEIAKPVHGVTVLSLWKELVTDPVYFKALKTASLQVLERLQADDSRGSRLFQDLENAVLKETRNPSSAREYAWKTIAIFASGGANAHRRITKTCRHPISAFLYVITNGAPILDRVSAAKGYLYSMPKEVNSLCDYGKSYHFWMTAYLARRLVKEGSDPLPAAAASYSVQKGYQFAKRDGGREPERSFREPSFSDWNNRRRMELSTSAAAAWFGALSAKGSPKNLDWSTVEEGIRQQFRGSEVRSGDPSFQFPGDSDVPRLMSAYREWKKILNPDSSFEYFRKKFGQ